MKSSASLFCFFGCILCSIFFSGQQANAQAGSNKFNNSPDTLNITLDSAEQNFLKSNLLLLAGRFNVSSVQALILQAKLYNNPNFQIGQGIYSGNPHQFLAFSGPAAEQSAQLSEVIVLAGKRRKQIAIANSNFMVAEDNLYDLLRTLKSQLRSDFYTIFFNIQSMKVYGQEIDALGKISSVFNAQLSKGYVAKKEVLRIQAQLFSLQNEMLALQQQILTAQSDLNVLLGRHNVWFVPLADTARLNRIKLGNFPLQNLVDTALSNRFDLKAAFANTQLGRQNHALQKALAIPDLSLGLAYDRAGGLANNYYGLTLGIDLPLFNRNQGNIKNSRFQISAYDAQYQNQLRQVENDVMKAYLSARQNEALSLSISPAFASDFEHLTTEVLKNYQKRNLGLLEFLDFYDSFKQNTLQINSLRLNRMNAYEQINFATGRDIFR